MLFAWLEMIVNPPQISFYYLENEYIRKWTESYVHYHLMSVFHDGMGWMDQQDLTSLRTVLVSSIWFGKVSMALPNANLFTKYTRCFLLFFFLWPQIYNWRKIKWNKMLKAWIPLIISLVRSNIKLHNNRNSQPTIT